MGKGTVLITGGNSGIGLATAGALGQKGHKVVITARDAGKGEAAIAELKTRYGVDADLLSLDLGSFDSIRACAEQVLARYPDLSLLVNNAGLALSERQETVDGFEYTFGVNYLGPVLLTRILLDRLKQNAPARIVFLSSAAHVGARNGMDWDDLERKGKYDGQAYCQAKLGLIYYARELAARLKGDKVSVFSVNPGFVTTGFGMDGDAKGFMYYFFKVGKYWMSSPDKGAIASIYAATEPGIEEHTGAYIDRGKIAKPSKIARDEAAQKRMWELTEELLSQASKKTRPIRVRA